ncbi:uncharacterized protein LOC115632940 [Scaptodrosophila lebanonensis]|uniref:Uncharacterized protein LOC115632940 n=1 Tax=Drosophila lebanonensis TaxID=7225 RepID=A0A6J2UCA5_DROLE|nr:uncharacterized protein LOC115632940 [Scaptodrosophila lebanonensis]
MYTLGYFVAIFKHWLRRFYVYIGSAWALFALLTYFLDHQYATHGRDLMFWREFLAKYLHPSMMIPMSLINISLLFKFCVFLTVLLVHLFPGHGIENYLERRRRQKYASYIMRRLLLQLELAMWHRPKKLELHDALTQLHYQYAQASAFRAVSLFRRDAEKLLVKRHEESDQDLDFFVLDEEELMLQLSGYHNTPYSVTDQVLAKLLYPQREVE